MKSPLIDGAYHFTINHSGVVTMPYSVREGINVRTAKDRWGMDYSPEQQQFKTLLYF